MLRRENEFEPVRACVKIFHDVHRCVCPQIIEYDPDALKIRIFLIFSSNSGSRHSRWYLIRYGFILAIADGIMESNSILLEEVENFRYDLTDHMEECVEDGNYADAMEY